MKTILRLKHSKKDKHSTEQRNQERNLTTSKIKKVKRIRKVRRVKQNNNNININSNNNAEENISDNIEQNISKTNKIELKYKKKLKYRKSILKKLKQSSFNFEIKSQVKTCIICFDTILKKIDLTYIKCGHYYHKACIEKWVLNSSQCPICKGSIFIKENIFYLNSLFHEIENDSVYSDADLDLSITNPLNLNQVNIANNEQNLNDGSLANLAVNRHENRNSLNRSLDFIDDRSSLNRFLNRLVLSTYRNRLFIQDQDLNNYSFCEFVSDFLLEKLRKFIIQALTFIDKHPFIFFFWIVICLGVLSYYTDFTDFSKFMSLNGSQGIGVDL